MKKRLLSVLLALCIVLTLLPSAVFAADSDFTIEDGVLIAYNGSGGDVVIPDGVTSIGDGAFGGCISLTSVIIPDGVTSIGSSAFNACTGLTSVTIPASVVSIGTSGSPAFGGCSGLTSAGPIGSDCNYQFGWIHTIPAYAFSGCKNLISITIPDGITAIGEGAFYLCEKLDKLIIPQSVSSFGFNPFSWCSSLLTAGPIGGNYNYEFGWTDSIPDRAFNDCPNLSDVTIPNSITHIGNSAFWGCSSLTSINIPRSVTAIGEYAFTNTGIISVDIPGSVTNIGKFAFSNCSDLCGLTIPASVTTMGGLVISNCNNMLSAGPLDDNYNCKFGWTQEIPGQAFSYSNLTSVVIPEGITTIKLSAFNTCQQLTSITIPKSVSAIEKWAFNSCDSLNDIYYAGSESDWAKISIDDENTDLFNATIHYNSTGPDIGEKPEYMVYCNGGYEVFDVSLENCMKKTASTTYNPQLAHMLIAMSNSVYSASDMEKTFESFGFEEKNTLRHEDELLNYSIGLKSIGDETLVLVSIRGTGGLGDDIWSWASNLSATVDLKGQHLGFSTTTNSLYKKLDEFISSRSSGSGKVTYVITGFSRGAAVTNLLAARLLSEGISKSDVYAYAFACPDTIISAKDLTTGYECIFNIADVNDLVSWSPQTLWGFSNNWTKYGHSRWFSHDWNDYGNLAIDNIFNIGSAHDQVKYLDYLRQEKSIAEYKMRDEAKTVLDEAADKRSEQFWTNIKNGGRPQIVEIVVACPVNIEIYASGQLVGSITNNLVNVNDESKVYISIVGDKKSVYLLADDTYTFNLTATGEGTMSYTVQNVDVATRDVVDEQVFEQVALVSEKQFISEVKVEENIATDVKTQEVKLYVLGGDGEPEKEVLPDGKGTEVPLDSLNDIYTVSFDTTVISLKVPSMKTGSDGKLSSLPRPTRSGYTFIGWFTAAIGGEQITTETTFVCDTTVYAHWTYVGGDTTTNPGNPGYYPGSGYWGNYTPPTYAITIQPPANGTIAVSPKSASKGSTVTITAVPDDGYQLGTLTISDSNGKLIALTDKGNGKYTFTMPNGKVSIDATFLPVEALWSNPFTDITEGAWYYEAVRFVQGNGLMSGYGNGIFAPDANLSRAMMAQILYNKEGRPTVTASTFADVAEGAWYTNAVSWAAAHGIVDGYGNGLFGPNDNITREQLAVMLWRYAGEPVATDKELHFNDADSASGYAVDALCWATDNGIINGKGNDILDPRAQATRAEVAQMLMNYLKK